MLNFERNIKNINIFDYRNNKNFVGMPAEVTLFGDNIEVVVGNDPLDDLAVYVEDATKKSVRKSIRKLIPAINFIDDIMWKYNLTIHLGYVRLVNWYRNAFMLYSDELACDSIIYFPFVDNEWNYNNMVICRSGLPSDSLNNSKITIVRDMMYIKGFNADYSLHYPNCFEDNIEVVVDEPNVHVVGEYGPYIYKDGQGLYIDVGVPQNVLFAFLKNYNKMKNKKCYEFLDEVMGDI